MSLKNCTLIGGYDMVNFEINDSIIDWIIPSLHSAKHKLTQNNSNVSNKFQSAIVCFKKKRSLILFFRRKKCKNV